MSYMDDAKHTQEGSAEFSPCRVYRYALRRWWDKSKGYALFVGLNPSTADETCDDPTIRRCIRFAADWGYGGLCMANLFALRATDPKVMMAHDEPVGEENDEWLKTLSHDAKIVIAAWGNSGRHRNRDKAAMHILQKAHRLGVTKGGCPRHPLYVPAETQPEPFLLT